MGTNKGESDKSIDFACKEPGYINVRDMRSCTIGELREIIKKFGEKSYRASQIYRWLHVEKVDSFNEMTNIPTTLRERMEEEFDISLPKIKSLQVSKIDGTRKYLFDIGGGSAIESVFMRYHHGNSVCVSTQSGCRMGCKFCASTIHGLDRDLLPSQMLGQIYAIEKDTKEKVSNVVLMGSGEPLDNFENVLRFIELISDKNGANISCRNITLSTCGLIPEMKKLSKMNLKITLAVSLHAATDETRKKLMPIANKYSISELMEACREYFDSTRRRVTFEYSLVSGINDTRKEALELVRLLKGMNCHVNLIPVNNVNENNFKKPSSETISNFRKILESGGLNVTVRRRMGVDIDGACGQLRNSVLFGEDCV